MVSKIESLKEKANINYLSRWQSLILIDFCFRFSRSNCLFRLIHVIFYTSSKPFCAPALDVTLTGIQYGFLII